MPLHVYLFLFIITTGKISAVLYKQCGGTSHTHQGTSGHIHVSLPGTEIDTDSPKHHQGEKLLLETVCTWMIDVPSGRAVRLKLETVDSASRVFFLCNWDRGEQLLKPRLGALLSGCDRDKATLTWRATGHAPHAVQLFYIQEVGRNSSERPTSQGQDSLSTATVMFQTGSGITAGKPTTSHQGQNEGSEKERGRGRPSPQPRWSHGFMSPSAPSHKAQGLDLPPSLQSGLTEAGQADREAPPLPQEDKDNGADTSGAARVTEGRGLAGEIRHTHMNTRRAQTARTHSPIPRVSSTETNSRVPRALSTDASSPARDTPALTAPSDGDLATDTLAGTGKIAIPEIHTGGHEDRSAATHATQSDPTATESTAPHHAYTPRQPSLLISGAPSSQGEIGTTLGPHGERGPGEVGHSQPTAWRSVRSTHTLHPSLNPEVTPDLLQASSGSNITDTYNEILASSSSLSSSSSSSSSSASSSSLSSSSSQAPSRTSETPPTHSAEFDSLDEPKLSVSSSPHINSQAGTSLSVNSDNSSHTPLVETHSGFEDGETLQTLSPRLSPVSSSTQQHAETVTLSPPPYTLNPYTQAKNKTPNTETYSASRPRDFTDAYKPTNDPRDFSVSPSVVVSPDNSQEWTTSPRGFPAIATATLTLEDVVQKSETTTVSDQTHSSDVTMTTETNEKGEAPPQATGADNRSYPFNATQTFLPDASHGGTHTSFITSSPTYIPSLTPVVVHEDASSNSSAREYSTQKPTTLFVPAAHTLLPITTSPTEPNMSKSFSYPKTIPTQLPRHTQTEKHTHQAHTLPPWPSPTTVSVVRPFPDHITTTHSPTFSGTTTDMEPGQRSDAEPGEKEKDRDIMPTAAPHWLPSRPTTRSVTPRTTSVPPGLPPHRAHPHPSPGSTTGGPALTTATSLDWSSSTTRTPKYFIVPDQTAAIRVESIELLLQISLEEPTMDSPGLEEETTAWMRPYLLRAPGYSRLLGAWSSGRVVQSLVEFRTRGALDWLGREGPGSLLERTELAQAVRERRSLRGSKVTNITLGGLQGAVCDWLLRCPEGYQCVYKPGTANYSCSSVCHSDYCHHHGICTHHPAQLPICRCLAGEDSWYVGKRCDVRMTRARLVGACLAILVTVATLIGILALVAVRRYRTILIQAKVDQTRSSYRRFNHFDELSGRFWLRSWAGSADSLDNPAFTRSDELLHLRALDRTCCYHDDTLSLASTCPSHGTHVNTVYPHSSQYGWRGSEVSMGECVLDSGKASDLSVCSWPVEPIHWTPFPLLQQLASHSNRTPTLRASRPRSYCEGMELVDMGKSWTA